MAVQGFLGAYGFETGSSMCYEMFELNQANAPNDLMIGCQGFDVDYAPADSTTDRGKFDRPSKGALRRRWDGSVSHSIGQTMFMG